ncbi:MAG TPA: hypothetical protein VGF94_10965 [Kofleriaceae bacterium]|jgi:hypothetical protein
MRGATLLLVLAACGSSNDELTCKLLADPTNCWADAAAQAASCLAMHATPGALGADRTSCTWSDGSKVMFDAPLPQTTPELDHLAFTVTAPGCTWSFDDTFQNHLELTVGSKTEVAELQPNNTFELQCDDGTDYTTSFNTLFTCQLPARPPTDGFDVEPTSFQFTLSAVNAPTPLFTCM